MHELLFTFKPSKKELLRYMLIALIVTAAICSGILYGTLSGWDNMVLREGWIRFYFDRKHMLTHVLFVDKIFPCILLFVIVIEKVLPALIKYGKEDDIER